MSETLTTGSPAPHPAPDANLGYLFRLAYQRFRALLEAELHDLGLSAQEFAILSVFETRSELSTSELARIAQVTRQTMHTAIVRLEAAGLLERRAKNQRVVLVAPTERGGDVLETANSRIRTVERTAFAGFDRGEQLVVRAWLAGLSATAPSTPSAEPAERRTHEP